MTTAVDVARGVSRLFVQEGFSPIQEFTLANGLQSVAGDIEERLNELIAIEHCVGEARIVIAIDHDAGRRLGRVAVAPDEPARLLVFAAPRGDSTYSYSWTT